MALADTVSEEVAEFKAVMENKPIVYAEDLEFIIDEMFEMTTMEKLQVWPEDLYKEATPYIIKTLEDVELLSEVSAEHLENTKKIIMNLFKTFMRRAKDEKLSDQGKKAANAFKIQALKYITLAEMTQMSLVPG